MRVLVVDDHEVVTWGLRTMLMRHAWVERCLQATDGGAALALARRYAPDVAVVDLSLGDRSGTELCARLKTASPATKVLLMSAGASVPHRTIELAGASGFVSKQWTVDEMIATIRVVGLGVHVTSEPPPASSATLTMREEQILEHMARGATDAEIARGLYLSVHTVKQHARAAYRKLHARNRTDAVQRAQRLGLLG
jgi:two-component system response regulator DesR